VTGRSGTVTKQRLWGLFRYSWAKRFP